MANSPILQIPLLSTSQASKETTINTMVSYLERAMNDAVQLDMVNGNLTLPVTDFMRYMLFSMVNVASGSILTVPNQKRIFVIDNRGNANALSVSNGADTKEVPADAIVIFHSSATRLTYLSNSAWTGYDDLMPSEEPNGRHAFWRVRFLSGVVANTVEVGELIMSQGPSGSQLASGGTPISSGTYNGTTPAANAFDGNVASVWRSQTATLSGGTVWLGYQFSEAVSISSIQVKMPAPSTDRRPTSGVVEFSDDGVTWFEGWQFSAWVWDGGIADVNVSTHPRYLKSFDQLSKLDDVDVISSPPQDGQVITWSAVDQKWVAAAPSDSDAAVTHRFWRVFIAEASDPTNCNVAEIEFRTTPGVEEQATGGVSIDGGTISGYPSSNAFDANDSTIVSLSPHELNYIGYDFLTPKKVTEIYIRAGSDPALAPKSFRIEWSDNGQSWQIAGVISNKTDWTAGGEMLITPTLNFQELPDGGTTGQVLAKNSDSDGDVKWVDPTVPAGGTTGQVLAKKSNYTGDVEWIDPPAGGAGGTSFRFEFSTTADPAYAAGDTVSFDNDIWLCVIAGTTTTPGLDASWRNLTADSGGGSTGLPALTGNAGRILAVKTGEDGVEWIEPPEGGISGLHKSASWRVLFKANGGDARVGLAELQMRLMGGGEDAAVGGTPEASTSFIGTAATVFDDAVNNSWLANGVLNEWVSYTFSQEVTIREIVLTSVAEAGYGPGTAPKDFAVQYFDPINAQWVDEWSVTGATFTAESESKTFANPNPVYDFETVSFANKTASATLVAADLGKVVRFVNAVAATYTIPTQADVGVPVGTQIDVIAETANDVTIAGAVGVTLKNAGSLTIKGPATKVTLLKVDLNEWDVVSSGGGSTGGGTGGATTLDELNDVVSSSASDGALLRFNGGTAKWEPVYIKREFSAFTPGTLGVGSTLIRHVVSQAFVLPVALNGSQASAATAAAAASTLSVRKNGTQIGTINFAAGASVGTFTLVAAIAFAAGDVLSVIAPSPADASLAGVSISLIGE